MTLHRRSILKGAGAILGADLPWQAAFAKTPSRPTAAHAARLAMTTACFRHNLVPPIGEAAMSGPRFDLLGAPKFIKDTFGVTNVEVWSRTVPDTSLDYFKRLRAAAHEVGSRIFNVQIDGDYDLNNTDSKRRADSIVFAKGWMDRAHAAGAPTVRINIGAGPRGTALNLEPALDSIRALIAYGRTIGVRPLLENHGGVGSKIDNVVTVLKALNDPTCRAIADWGITDATTLDERIADIGKLFPYLEIVSAKGIHFDSADQHVDYPIAPLVQASEAAGFRGVYSVEMYSEPDYAADPVAAARGMIAAISSALRA